MYVHNDRANALGSDKNVTLEVHLCSGTTLSTSVVRLEVPTGAMVVGGIGPGTGVLVHMDGKYAHVDCI